MHRLHLLASIVFTAALLVVPMARSTSPGLVVSQVYAGGGNSGAAFTNDFVELFNRGSTPVDVTGWTVQYASAASTAWQATTLAGSIQPGHYYLLQLASAASIGSPLPTPDATGTTNLAASGGKVALVDGSVALSCGASAGSCSTVPGLVDFVGYGSAADYEGSAAAPALSSTTAAARVGSGCTDTDSNSSDFSALAPGPRTASSPAASCGSEPAPEEGVAQNASVDVDVQPVLSIALERPALSFGTAAAGETPTAISEQVSVVSNNATGYALTIHRSAFTPADLPLGVSATAPTGGQLGGPLAGGATAPIPIAPAADLRRRHGQCRQRLRRRRLADEHRIHRPASGRQRRPLHGDHHVHAGRPMILCMVTAACLLAPADGAGAGRPLVSIVATPSHVALIGRAQQTIRVQNTGSQRVVVDVVRAGFALDLRGRPKVAPRGGGRAAATWLTVRPRVLAIPPGRSRLLAVSATPPRRAEPGDHDALLLLASRPRRRGSLAVRMRLGVVVAVRIPGRIVRRVVPVRVRVRRVGHGRFLDLLLDNRGNVTETLTRGCVGMSLVRGSRILARITPTPRRFLPRTLGIAEFRYRGPARGRLRVQVPGEHASTVRSCEGPYLRIRLS